MFAFIVRTWTVIFLFGLIWFSIFLLQMSATANSLPMAATIVRQNLDQQKWLPVVQERSDKLLAEGSCLDPARQKIAEIYTLMLTQKNPATDYKAWSGNAGRLQHLLQDNLDCDPSNSKNWSRLALLEWMQSYDRTGAEQRLEASFLLSPVLYDDLTQRLAYWSQIEAWRAGPYNRDSESDIRTLVRYAKPDDIVSWARKGVEPFKVAVREEIVKLPPTPHRAQLEMLLSMRPGADR